MPAQPRLPGQSPDPFDHDVRTALTIIPGSTFILCRRLWPPPTAESAAPDDVTAALAEISRQVDLIAQRVETMQREGWEPPA